MCPEKGADHQVSDERHFNNLKVWLFFQAHHLT
jgi:hypothetical protein